MNRKQQGNDPDQSNERRKVYQKPVLERFGDVASLTQASSGPCWLDGEQGACIPLNMAMDA